MDSRNDLQEKLAGLVHYQWSRWTRYMINNYSPENIKKWQSQIETPYDKLTEAEKDSDRYWAREISKLFSKVKR